MPSVSVVVPIYNVEKYLSKCVESLLSQSLRDIEVVLVDDGTQDDGGAIAEKYAFTDQRIKVVHQDNRGLGPARNSGIKVATGDYVGFVDGDDWVEPDMFEGLYRTAREVDADIVVSGHCDVSNGEKTYIKTHPLAGQIIEGDSIEPVRLNLYGHRLGDEEVESFPMSVCMSIYRRSLIDDNSLQFEEILSEDVFFNLKAYRAARRIAFTGDTGYCYRKDGQDSITRTFSDSKLDRYKTFISTLMDRASHELASIRESCEMRVRRTAIDYARLYIGLIAQSGLSEAQQRSYAHAFVESGFLYYCKGFPLKTLPLQQRIFQVQLEKGSIRAALALARLRLSLKKGAK